MVALTGRGWDLGWDKHLYSISGRVGRRICATRTGRWLAPAVRARTIPFTARLHPRPPIPPVPYPALPHRSTHAWRELKALVEKVQHRRVMEVAGRGKGRVRERRIGAADEAARRRASRTRQRSGLGRRARPTATPHPGDPARAQ